MQAPSAEPTSLCTAFAELNEPFIRRAVSLRSGGDERPAVDSETTANWTIARKTPIITFSHFLPRQECCIEKRFLTEQYLMKVIGSNTLDAQIRELRSDIHVV